MNKTETPQQLPPPPPGMKWHREDGWKEGDLPQGYRPLVKGERIQLGDEGFYCDVFAKFKDIIGEYPFEKARTTRLLTFTHEGKEWTYHRPGDPMPTKGGSKSVQLLLGDGIVGKTDRADLCLWDTEPSTQNQIIGWRYAETTKTVELGPEDVIAKLKEAIAMLETLANAKA